MRLETKIDEKGIYMSYFPFVRKNISWDEIAEAQVVCYGFVGGWGIRFWTKYGTLYNVKGNMGLAIQLKNNKKMCIGTQQPTEMQKIVARYFTNN